MLSRLGISTLVFLIDVDENRCEQHGALNHLLVVDADAHDRHTVVEHAHDKGADHYADHLAYTARRRCTADEHGSDYVQFKTGAPPGGSRC